MIAVTIFVRLSDVADGGFRIHKGTVTSVATGVSAVQSVGQPVVLRLFLDKERETGRKENCIIRECPSHTYIHTYIHHQVDLGPIRLQNKGIVGLSARYYDR